jgi:phosphate uptake regulator
MLLVPRNVLEKNEEKPHLKEFTIHITSRDDPQSIARKIISLYTISADVIHMSIRDGECTTEQKTVIKKTARMLLGSEIISETSREITIHVLINHPAFPIERAVRRMFAIATIMDQNVISALKTFDQSLLQEVLDSDSDLDRLNLYVIRQLKHGIEHNLFKEMEFRSPKEFLGYRVVVKNLENMGDNAVGAAKNVLALRRLVENQILTVQKSIDHEVYDSVLNFNSFANQLLQDALKALFKRDYQLADKTITQFTLIGLKHEKDVVNLIFSKKMDPNIAAVLWLLIDNSRKMMEYSRDIAHITLHRTIEQTSTT